MVNLTFTGVTGEVTGRVKLAFIATELMGGPISLAGNLLLAGAVLKQSSSTSGGSLLFILAFAGSVPTLSEN